AVGDLRDLVVPGHVADDLATVGLHGLHRFDRDLVAHSQARLSTVFSNVAPGTVMFHFTVQLYSSSKRSRVYGVGGPCHRLHDCKSRSSMRPPVSATKYLMNGLGSFSSASTPRAWARNIFFSVSPSSSSPAASARV